MIGKSYLVCVFNQMITLRIDLGHLAGPESVWRTWAGEGEGKEEKEGIVLDGINSLSNTNEWTRRVIKVLCLQREEWAPQCGVYTMYSVQSVHCTECTHVNLPKHIYSTDN